MKWSGRGEEVSLRGVSGKNINSVFKSLSNNHREEKLSGYWFQLLVDSFGEPKLERLAKTVTECKSKFEWVACIVNGVLRRSVKIHMDIPQEFFFPPSRSLWSCRVSHGPLRGFFFWFWWALSHPMGPFESQEGITKCWNRLWGLLLYNMSSVRGFTDDIQLNSIREQEICRSMHKWTMVNFFLLCLPPEPCKWCKMCHVVGFRAVVSTTECCSAILYALRGQSLSWPKRETEYHQTPFKLSKLGCSSFIVSDLLSFFVLGWFSKSLWTDCSGFRSPVCSSGSSLGGIPLPANHGVTMPFCEGLREVGNGTRVALTVILNLPLTHSETVPGSVQTAGPYCDSLAAPFHSNEGNVTLFFSQVEWSQSYQAIRLTCIRAICIWASVACLANSQTPADFLSFFFSYHINWTTWNPSLCSVCCGFSTKGNSTVLFLFALVMKHTLSLSSYCIDSSVLCKGQTERPLYISA